MRAVAIAIVFLSAFVTGQTSAPDVAELKPKAAAGDVRAQVALAHAFEDGIGAAQNDQDAAKWYRVAADQGDPEAQNELGVMYRLGRGVEKDFAQAAQWYHKAAKQGYAPAMFNLATIYYNGDGVPVDDKTAYAWFVLAEVAGSKLAGDGVQRLTHEMPEWKLRDGKVLLADMLLKGDEVKRNLADAIQTYQEIAPRMPILWVRLGRIYLESGVPSDTAKAEHCCEAAAKAGVSAGMVCLAYLNGSGLLGAGRDREAFHWYEQGARAGNPMAAYGLGIMYYEGWGTKQDLQQAYKWIYLASRSDIPPAKSLAASLATQLGPKISEKIINRAREEQSRAFHQRKPTNMHVLNREDMEFTKVLSDRSSSTPN